MSKQDKDGAKPKQPKAADSKAPDHEDGEGGDWNPSHDTRFREGNPGGPGRPKGSINLGVIIDAAFSAKTTIKTGGKTIQLTKLQVMIMQLVKQATEGNLKAIPQAIALWEKYAPPEKKGDILPEVSAYELEALHHYMTMQGLIGDGEEDNGDENVAA